MTTTTAAAIVTLKELQINGETCIYVGPSVLVKSGSTEGAWYIVEDGRCTCPGFVHRGACRHLAAAAVAEDYDRMGAQPVEAPKPMCKRCEKKPVSTFAGVELDLCHCCYINRGRED